MARYPRLFSLPNSATRLISDMVNHPFDGGSRGPLLLTGVRVWIQNQILPALAVRAAPQPGIPAQAGPTQAERLIGTLVQDQAHVPVQRVADIVAHQGLQARQLLSLGQHRLELLSVQRPQGDAEL